MSTIWSPAQERMLSAMGYEWYAPARVATAVIASTATAAAVSTSSVPSAPAGAGVPAHRDRFWQALFRAAGNNDVAALGVDISALRRDPLLKRKLWPQLRALRRATGIREPSAARMPETTTRSSR